MNLTNILLIILFIIMLYLIFILSQKTLHNKQHSVVYLRDPRLNYWGGQGPIWYGPRPGRFKPRFRRRFWW